MASAPYDSPLVEIVREVGDTLLALRPLIFDRPEDYIEVKADDTPVSIADRLAHHLLRTALQERFPLLPLLSEEGTRLEQSYALQKAAYFASDPLDNTAAYLKGDTTWSINLGIVHEGVPTAGVIYFPELGEIYFTGMDGKAYMQTQVMPVPQPILVREWDGQRPPRVAAKHPDSDRHHLGDRPVEHLTAYSQHRTCLVARGDCDSTSISAELSTWDVAGPHAVLLKAGGDLYVPDGNDGFQPLRYGKETTVARNIVAVSHDVAAHLGFALSPVRGQGAVISIY